MREVDQALARAYAQRGASEPASVPPSPHVAPDPRTGPAPVGYHARRLSPCSGRPWS